MPLARLVHVRARAVLACVAMASCLALATAPLRATYRSFSGTTVAAASMVHAPGALAEPQGGKVLVPVVEGQSVSAWSALRGWLDPELEVAREESTHDADRDVGVRQMARSAAVASHLATARLGGDAMATRAQLDNRGFGGPSAGLAFTLELLDQLSPGDLTKGLDVAVTGEVTESGLVLPVGGIGHKALAAGRAGADVFLVPAGNYLEAIAHPRPYRVIAVHDVDQAVALLDQL